MHDYYKDLLFTSSETESKADDTNEKAEVTQAEPKEEQETTGI